ncbi:MerR family transcriptional regulator [Rickettsia endosymbiont of Orchestes rusci]|uniref:MerR family transcriptional regulator n=1 Tax=Rickettsia endosymbiont of Orchestes rusci TaxID=3066250 RepID=UPI0039784A1D
MSQKKIPEKIFNKKLDKKYYSTSEAIKFLNISSHQLRYLEDNILNLSIYKIKNRRYYTDRDLKTIQDYITNNKKISVKQDTTPLSYKIDILIKNLNILSNDITKFLANFSAPPV